MSKKKRKGRAIDHVWRFVKYKDDMAIYAKCSCGFVYPCYKQPDRNKLFVIVQDAEKLYRFCPNCGSRKTRYIDEVVKINKSLWRDLCNVKW